MSRPTRQTAAGRAYLDLQNLARREKRSTQELLTLYVVERWLARLADSSHVDHFVLKGGVLLAALDTRRATVDADLLARNLSNNESTVLAPVSEIAAHPGDDGVTFLVDTISARTIRDQDQYSGLRIAMDCGVATAAVKLRLDVNFGDPVTPDPQRVLLPALRPGASPISVLGYPLETVLAEKIATAIALGDANTRIRDYADIFMLTRRHAVDGESLRKALDRTCAHREVGVAALSGRVHELARSRATAYGAFRVGLGPDGASLPTDFRQVVSAVIAFTDPLVSRQHRLGEWDPGRSQWRVRS